MLIENSLTQLSEEMSTSKPSYGHSSIESWATFAVGISEDNSWKWISVSHFCHLFHGNAHIGHIRDRRFTTLLIPKKYFLSAGWKKLYVLKISNYWTLSCFHHFPQMQNHPYRGSHKSLSLTCGCKYSLVEWQLRWDDYLKCTDDGGKTRQNEEQDSLGSVGLICIYI